VSAPVPSPQELMRQGLAQARAARDDLAVQSFEAAIRLKPDFADAYYELGSACHRLGQCDAAINAFNLLLALAPGHVPAKLGLGAVLIDAKRPRDAESPLRQALFEPGPAPLKAALHVNLGLALRRQRRDQEALAHYDQAGRLNPALKEVAIHRAGALQNLNRHDEALAEYRRALSGDPLNPLLHHYYNELLYRLGRSDEYLKSYDRAPKSRDLQRAKALFLRQSDRSEEAYGLYRDLLARDPTDSVCIAGAAEALIALQRLGEAAQELDNALPQNSRNGSLLVLAAEVSLRRGDAAKALTLCRQAVSISPFDQTALAMLGTCLRLLGDEQEESLTGYRSLIGVFDLDPPEGYSRMEDFNADLCAYLAGLHPQTREFIDQSLRGGTQTPDHILGAGHPLVDRLEARIHDALASYVGNLQEDETHPFLSRRSREFQYAGSWSSCLKDGGFHKNHVHPHGWISSCYYVQVPEAVKDQKARQGWIKFGEPSFDAGLADPVRRAVQPVAGRLVLFPSYMWHGTIPFQGAPRMTLAFDALPVTA